MLRCFAIQGWFSQEGLRIATNPELAVPMLYDPQGRRYPFSGILVTEKEGDGEVFTGYLVDRCGNSEVKGVLKGTRRGTVLIFKKKYAHREDEIEYKLTLLREEGFNFRGTYKGDAVGKGEAYAMLKSVSDSFFK